MISQPRWPAAPVDPAAIARALQPFGEEDGVYQFVAQVARGYQGQPPV